MKSETFGKRYPVQARNHKTRNEHEWNPLTSIAATIVKTQAVDFHVATAQPRLGSQPQFSQTLRNPRKKRLIRNRAGIEG